MSSPTLRYPYICLKTINSCPPSPSREASSADVFVLTQPVVARCAAGEGDTLAGVAADSQLPPPPPTLKNKKQTGFSTPSQVLENAHAAEQQKRLCSIVRKTQVACKRHKACTGRQQQCGSRCSKSLVSRGDTISHAFLAVSGVCLESTDFQTCLQGHVVLVTRFLWQCLLP